MQKALCLSEPAHAVEVATSTLTETASSNPSVSTTRWRLRLLTFLHASTSVRRSSCGGIPRPPDARQVRHQRPLIKEALLVGFFLAGLVVLGGLQRWWLQPLVSGLEPMALFFGAVSLTAITDNAALTYLGAQISGISEAAKYMLVAGAVAGGGLTVIANAPNPAGAALLRRGFLDESIGALGLLAGALAPTLVAMGAFLLL